MQTTASNLSLRERNKLRLRGDLMDAVLGVYQEDGFTGCTVENIARFCGCAKATAYAYFPGGRDEMLCAVYERLTEQLMADVERLRAATNSAQSRIMAVAEALLSLATDPEVGGFYVQINPSLGPVLQPVVGKASKAHTDLIASDLAADAGDQSEAGDRFDSLAVLFVGACREASITVVRQPERKSDLLDGLAFLTTSLLQAICQNDQQVSE